MAVAELVVIHTEKLGLLRREQDGLRSELLAACDHHPRLKVCMDTCHAQAAG